MMEEEPPDLIAWVVRGGLESIKWTYEQIRNRNSSGGSKLTEEIEAAGALDPNWYLVPTEKHEPTGAIRMTLTKTASALASNVSVESTGYTQLQFIGDTEWPGEISTMEPVTFVVLNPGFFGEFTPRICVSWTGIDGVRREKELEVRNSFGMIR